MLESVVEFLAKSTVVLVLIGGLCSVKSLSATERHNLATLGLAAVAGVAALVWLTGTGGVPAWRIALPEQAAHMIPPAMQRPLEALVDAGASATTAIQSLQQSAPGVASWSWMVAACVAVTLALAASTIAGRLSWNIRRRAQRALRRMFHDRRRGWARGDPTRSGAKRRGGTGALRVKRYVRGLPVKRTEATDRLGSVEIRTDDCATPWTWGIRQPVIVLPEDFDAWAPDRRDAALAHELSHISRRDCLVDVLSRWLCNLFWFQPLVWLLWLRQRRYAESACDDAVLRDGADPCDYAETLLTIARSNLHAKPMGLAAGSGALRSRLRSILHSDVRRSPMTLTKRGMFGVLAIAIVLPVGACSVAKIGNGNAGRDHIPMGAFSVKLSPAEVAENEQRLAEDPVDIVARTRLISHYAQNEVHGLRQRTCQGRSGCTRPPCDLDDQASVAQAGLAAATSDDDRTLMEQCLEYCHGP